jgi:hypothetical protein
MRLRVTLAFVVLAASLVAAGSASAAPSGELSVAFAAGFAPGTTAELKPLGGDCVDTGKDTIRLDAAAFARSASLDVRWDIPARGCDRDHAHQTWRVTVTGPTGGTQDIHLVRRGSDAVPVCDGDGDDDSLGCRAFLGRDIHIYPGAAKKALAKWGEPDDHLIGILLEGWGDRYSATLQSVEPSYCIAREYDRWAFDDLTNRRYLTIYWRPLDACFDRPGYHTWRVTFRNDYTGKRFFYDVGVSLVDGQARIRCDAIDVTDPGRTGTPHGDTDEVSCDRFGVGGVALRPA